MPITGETAPDFELPNEQGSPVSLSDYRGKKVVLYFYPQDFTSGCEMQACSFRDSYPEIEAKNAVVLGVSPDSVESHGKFRDALNLPFHLLSDPDLEVARAWGSVREKANDDGSTSLRAQRSHFVIDEDGRVVDAQNPVSPGESRKLALEKL